MCGGSTGPSNISSSIIPAVYQEGQAIAGQSGQTQQVPQVNAADLSNYSTNFNVNQNAANNAAEQTMNPQVYAAQQAIKTQQAQAATNGLSQTDQNNATRAGLGAALMGTGGSTGGAVPLNVSSGSSFGAKQGGLGWVDAYQKLRNYNQDRFVQNYGTQAPQLGLSGQQAAQIGVNQQQANADAANAATNRFLGGSANLVQSLNNQSQQDQQRAASTATAQANAQSAQNAAYDQLIGSGMQALGSSAKFM